jgi:hypothetical protein
MLIEWGSRIGSEYSEYFEYSRMVMIGLSRNVKF